MQAQGRNLTCRDCGNTFVFTAGEQEFFSMKGFSEPTRCPDCRQARKRERNNTASPSYVGGGYGSAPSYGEPSGYGNGGSYMASGERRERVLYDAVCEQCGMATKVPFKPRGVRPVYCRDCFNNQR
jgi:CxxC-x17-CxxC domain-containing protein